MSTVNRITGLATGMDTDSIIEQLMKAERTPLNDIEKEKTTIEWQREALLDVNSKMLAFRNQALDMKLQGTYKSYTAESSNSKLVSATATTDAQEGVYKVTVKELATQTTLYGKATTQEVASSRFSNESDFSGKEFKITYNGETKIISFGENEGKINGADDVQRFRNLLQKKIDDAFGAGQINVDVPSESDDKFKLSFASINNLRLPITFSESSDPNKDALSIMGIDSGASTAFDTSETLGKLLGNSAFGDKSAEAYDDHLTSDQMMISINGKYFTFNKTDTLDTVFSTLNKDVEADINIRYSNSQERIILNRESYGAGRELALGGNEKFWNKIGLKLSDINNTEPSESAPYMQFGENAKFDISAPDGESATDIQVSSNNFTYGGVSMTFLEAKEGEQVTITVSKNVDEIYDKIKGFVDSYNDLLGTLNKYYKEEKTGYDPLTNEEREGLSEKQEEQWEEMAKKGILRRDSTLQSAITSMRSAVTSMVTSSSFSSLFQIGISTTSYDAVNTENNGKLTIDEDALKQAIKDDIDGVAGLFANAASQVQSGKVDTEKVKDELADKSFSVTYGGKTVNITFNKGYDLTNSDEANEFEDFLKNEFEKNFGAGTISVTYSNGRILFNSSKGVDLRFNSAATDDALAVLGIKDGAKYDSSEKGFAVKIYDICTNTMNSIIDKAGSTSNVVDNSILGQALKRKKEAISKFEDRLEALEDRYYREFAAMEDAISKMNSQSESLVNMLSSN